MLLASCATTSTTSLFPEDGRYLLPLKVAVQRREAVGSGDRVEVVLRLAGPQRASRSSSRS